MEFAVNKPIVVVLSANSELGLGLVESLLKSKEWNVFSTYRNNSEQLNYVYGQHEESPQKRVFQVDLSKWNEVSEMFEKIAAVGGIWGAINCAGEATAKTIKNLSSEEVTHSLQTNAVSAFNVTKCGLDFMSRNNIEQGHITLHPKGIPHGPAPGAMERSIGQTETQELAVMVDTFRPLMVTDDAMRIDDGKYYRSWVE
jgi:NAD(P)-dependent dehydrogenase (short-subunit alcohol dehydrogenase family)